MPARRPVLPSLKPQGPGCNDSSLRERVVNVATSLPFLAVGRHELGQSKNSDRKIYGLSMLAVGLAATAYHCSSGSIRKAFRRADYWTIALASSRLARVVHGGKVRIHHSSIATDLEVVLA
ncbi:hypothetical protein WJX84_012011 [Apatococcus fuscideae]|uniref:Uncharacterized protein n=1 Tax=Apatococcus fuscideae TaxID=2026836 RepID=A0AAW1RNY7_9CHLO